MYKNLRKYIHSWVKHLLRFISVSSIKLFIATFILLIILRDNVFNMIIFGLILTMMLTGHKYENLLWQITFFTVSVILVLQYSLSVFKVTGLMS